MIGEDIRLARELFERMAEYPELEALTQSLSITTFRYVPTSLDSSNVEVQPYLDDLNRELLSRLQNSGEAYLSNAVINGQFALRVCIVNFRTTEADIDALLALAARIGRDSDMELRPEKLGRRD